MIPASPPYGLQPWQWQTRRLLRAYPTGDAGFILFNGQPLDEQRYLSADHYASLLFPDNSELCSRNTASGIAILCRTQRLIAPLFGTFSELFHSGGAGIQEWGDLLRTTEGKEFLRSCSVINEHGKRTRNRSPCREPVDRRGLSQSVDSFLRFLATDSEHRRERLGVIALRSAQLFLSAAHLLEGFSLVRNSEIWTSNLRQDHVPHNPWFEKPGNFNLMADFFSKSLHDFLLRPRKFTEGDKRRPQEPPSITDAALLGPLLEGSSANTPQKLANKAKHICTKKRTRACQKESPPEFDRDSSIESTSRSTSPFRPPRKKKSRAKGFAKRRKPNSPSPTCTRVEAKNKETSHLLPDENFISMVREEKKKRARDAAEQNLQKHRRSDALHNFRIPVSCFQQTEKNHAR